MNILLVDNYDSFTWNVAQLLGELGATVEVVRNDRMAVADMTSLGADAVVISPGPGGPADAGVSCEAILHFAGRVPVLGICLGMQCIGHVFGARVVRAGELVHGKSSPVEHDGGGVFRGIPSPFAAGRYHSLALDDASLPDDLHVTARSAPSAERPDGVIMGVRHVSYTVEGVQFHPESILTEHGHALLGNFLTIVRTEAGAAA